MNAQAFHTAVLRLGLLEAADLTAAGIRLSKREQQMFDADAVTFFAADAGPTRRQQIFDLIEHPRTVPVVAVIEDRDAARAA
jgi:NAD(P)H-hydrate repair Nnr-like enzyme with NAD(P)H-hydrate dehydratase domain